jgi:hypothetical protein
MSCKHNYTKWIAVEGVADYGVPVRLRLECCTECGDIILTEVLTLDENEEE